MLTTVQGVFRNGKVELTEPVPEGVSGPVIVTFLPEPRSRKLSDLGIDQEQAADLRNRLGTFAEDWERPEMDVYDVD